MSLLVVVWSMIAAASGILALLNLFLWLQDRRAWVFLLFAVMAFGAAAVSLLEMFLFSSPDPVRNDQLITWHTVAIAVVLIPMVWSVRTYLPSARVWAAFLISLMWGIGLLINFLMPGNLIFSEITAVDQRMTFWGDTFYVPKGTPNEWKWLPDLTVVLIPLYMIDAFWRGRNSSKGSSSLVITIGVVMFVVLAGAHAMLVDFGVINSPYMIGAAFLFMVLSLTWDYAREVVRARVLEVELAQAHLETERLMRANQLGEVAGAIAHELKQPLTAMLFGAQAAQKFLARTEPDLDEIRDILADIVRDDKRARDIITNMWSMLAEESVPEEIFDPKSAIQEVIDITSKELDQNGVAVQFKTTGKLQEITGHRAAFQQVVFNLILNALHAIKESSCSEREIQISLAEEHDGVEMEVRDSGPGISEEVLQQLFKPFVTTKKGGLGMGLVISRRIVEAHGGRMTAWNVEGGGASFLIWLPERES